MSLFLSLWIAAIVEMVLYGLYISLFALFIWTVLHFRPSYYLLQFACGILAFLISTSFVILDICRIWNVMKVDGATGTRWYSDFFSSRISLVLSYLIIVNKTLASGVLIWRCYIIWNRSILICLPSLTFLTLSIVFSLYSNIKGYFLERAPNRWVIAVLSSFIITNITTISLILFKIWYETRYILRHSSSFRSQNPTGPTEMTTQQQHGHHHHQPPSPGKHFFGISSVIAIVLQTGIIYVIALIVHLIFCVISIVNNNNNNGRKSGAGTTSSGGGGFIILSAMISQLSGMMPTSIMVYVILAYQYSSSRGRRRRDRRRRLKRGSSNGRGYGNDDGGDAVDAASETSVQWTDPEYGPSSDHHHHQQQQPPVPTSPSFTLSSFNSGGKEFGQVRMDSLEDR